MELAMKSPTLFEKVGLFIAYYAVFFFATRDPAKQNVAPISKRIANDPSPVLGETVPPAVLVVPAVEAGAVFAVVDDAGAADAVVL